MMSVQYVGACSTCGSSQQAEEGSGTEQNLRRVGKQSKKSCQSQVKSTTKTRRIVPGGGKRCLFLPICEEPLRI
jgi:Fe-S cluster biogenesis protein NfuA